MQVHDNLIRYRGERLILSTKTTCMDKIPIRHVENANSVQTNLFPKKNSTGLYVRKEIRIDIYIKLSTK